MLKGTRGCAFIKNPGPYWAIQQEDYIEEVDKKTGEKYLSPFRCFERSRFETEEEANEVLKGLQETPKHKYEVVWKWPQGMLDFIRKKNEAGEILDWDNTWVDEFLDENAPAEWSERRKKKTK